MDSPKDAPGAGGQGRQDPEERIKQAGKGAATAARGEAEATVERGRQSAAAAAGSTAQALDETADNLSAQGQESLAQAASALSSRLAGLADQLEHRSIDELTNDARRLARDNPTLFIAGGLAVGMALSRFFMASAAHEAAPGGAAEAGAAAAAAGYGSADPGYPTTPPGASTPGYGGEAAVPAQGEIDPTGKSSTSTTGAAGTPGSTPGGRHG